MTETAAFWKGAPEVRNGHVQVADIKTEVFFFPSAQVAEYDGSFTNTQRMLQWHYKAADPPGECRSDLWFTHQLALRLKKLYAGSTAKRDEGFLCWIAWLDHNGAARFSSSDANGPFRPVTLGAPCSTLTQTGDANPPLGMILAPALSSPQVCGS